MQNKKNITPKNKKAIEEEPDNRKFANYRLPPELKENIEKAAKLELMSQTRFVERALAAEVKRVFAKHK